MGNLKKTNKKTNKKKSENTTKSDKEVISNRDALSFLLTSCIDEEESEIKEEEEDTDIDGIIDSFKDKNISEEELNKLKNIGNEDFKKDMVVLKTLKVFDKELSTEQDFDLSDMKDLMGELLVIVTHMFKNHLIEKYQEGLFTDIIKKNFEDGEEYVPTEMAKDVSTMYF